jgi:hypothetical protein
LNNFTNTNKKAAILYGKCGTGKSRAALEISKTLKYIPIVISCLDLPSSVVLNKYLTQVLLVNKSTLLILEDLDSLDFRLMDTLHQFFKSHHTQIISPLICTTNRLYHHHSFFYSAQMAPFHKAWTLNISFAKLEYACMYAIAQNFLHKTQKTLTVNLSNLILAANGDARKLITMLRWDTLFEYEQSSLTIFDVVKKLFHKQSLTEYDQLLFSQHTTMGVNILKQNMHKYIILFEDLWYFYDIVSILSVCGSCKFLALLISFFNKVQMKKIPLSKALVLNTQKKGVFDLKYLKNNRMNKYVRDQN